MATLHCQAKLTEDKPVTAIKENQSNWKYVSGIFDKMALPLLVLRKQKRDFGPVFSDLKQ